MAIINGKAIAAKIEQQAAEKTANLKKNGKTPKLAVVLVGDNKPSQTYIRKKQEAAERVGINFELRQYPADIKKDKLIAELKKIQKDKKLAGLIIQLPLPEHLYVPEVLNAVNPEIDVDCLTDCNLGKLVMAKKMPILPRQNRASSISTDVEIGTNKIEPPTPWAVVHILKDAGVDLVGKNITIIGMGALVGKPLAIMLANELASVTTCNSQTKNIKEKCLSADIIVTAVGKKINLLTADMVKNGAIVIDTGIVYEDEKMYGDVDFENVSKKAGLITPVPGGVGPITVSKLLLNTAVCAENFL